MSIDKKGQPGFDNDGKPHPGVHPETGARMAVTFEGLIREFGVREGIAKYEAIARIEGDIVDPITLEARRGRLFFDPAVERNYRPDLNIALLPDEARKTCLRIIDEKQVAEVTEPETQVELITHIAERDRTLPKLQAAHGRTGVGVSVTIDTEGEQEQDEQ
ncbi:MAG: hypothetical protein DMF68_13605 [Acidobacteria bacterium]|nr:MAG: hypothetical protein DMF68_13605 [Acidobacteriota bacterium]